MQFTNRCLLKWLKLWDTVVFGRERKSRPARTDRQASNQHSFKPNQGNQNPNRFKTKIEMTEELLEAELDQYKRPKFKVCILVLLQRLEAVMASSFLFVLLPQVALLSGPPGLGKTTLAHVIAKHAGYNVVEINARLVNNTNQVHSEALVLTSVMMMMLIFPQRRPQRRGLPETHRHGNTDEVSARSQ